MSHLQNSAKFGLGAVVLRLHDESFAVGGSGGHEFNPGGAEFRVPSCDADATLPFPTQSSACRDGGNGAVRPASGHPAHQLINRERHHPEHQMTQHLGMAAHAHAAPPEFILETAIDTLDARAFVVTSVLRQDPPAGTACPPLPLQLLLARAAPGVAVDDRDMPQGMAVSADFRGIIGAIHQVIQVADTLRRQGRRRDGRLAVVQRRRGRQATYRNGAVGCIHVKLVAAP